MTGAAPGPAPGAATALIGRGEAVADLGRTLRRTRLVSLLGPAGVGKTSLALALAERQRRHFGEVRLVELEAVREGALVAPRLAAALGTREEGRGDATSRLLEDGPRHRGLLVLDGCETSVDAVAEVLDPLLRAAPALTVLATSRERLGVPGEYAYRVPPLGVPDSGAARAPADLQRHAAVTLFLDRARRRVPAYASQAGDAEAVAEIVRRLDGLPLAIELAAAWAGELAPDALLDRLADRFQLLEARGGEPVSPRHSSLRAAIEAGYQALEPPERELFRRLALFAGGWSLESMGAVTGLPEPEGLDRLGRLVERSLVVVAGSQTPTRYRMLESLREYGALQLREAGETADAWARFGAYFLALAESAGPRLAATGGAAWLARLDQEQDNFRALLDAGPGLPASVALRVTSALTDFWHDSGRLTEGRLRLRAALARRPDGDAGAVSGAEYGAALLAWRQGDLAGAARQARRALAGARRAGSPRQAMLALQLLGQIALDGGSPGLARARLERALAGAEEVADPVLAATCRFRLGQVALAEDRLDEAEAGFRASLAAAAAAGAAQIAGPAAASLGLVQLRRGRPDLAEPILVDAVRASREAGGPRFALPMLEFVAQASLGRGDRLRAATLAGAAAALRERLGLPAGRETPLRARTMAELRPLAHRRETRAAYARGRRFDTATAIAYALGEPLPDFTGAAGLTRRQQEVAALIASGATNRQIGDRLGLSERTVDGHVEQIRIRLDVTSRVQIAAWWMERKERSSRPITV